MSSTKYPFRVLDQIDVIRRLPYLFGDGIESLEVNLSDSTTGKRIVVPGRGNKCDHVDVVDVVNSTGAGENDVIDWMCPVCGIEYCDTSEVEIDGLLLEILGEVDREDPEGGVRAINLDVDGSWSHVSEDPKERLPVRRKKRSRLTLDEIRRQIGGLAIDIDGESERDSPLGVIDLEDSD